MENSELEKALDAHFAQTVAEPTTATEKTVEVPPVVEDYTEKYKQSEAEKAELAARLAALESAPKEPVFASDFHKKAYEYATQHPEMDLDDAFREYAEMVSLKVEKLDDMQLLEKAFEIANKNSGLSKEELSTLFKRDYKNRFDYDQDLDDEDDIKFKQIQKKAEVVKAKALLSEEKAKYTPKKAEPQFTPQQLQEARASRENVANSYANTLAEKPITFAIDNHTFNFKLDKEAIDDSRLAVIDIPAYLNERYGSKNANGEIAWDFPALQRDFAMINSIDRLTKEAFESGVNIGKETILKQANGIAPVAQTTAVGGTISNEDRQKAFSKQIAQQIYN